MRSVVTTLSHCCCRQNGTIISVHVRLEITSLFSVASLAIGVGLSSLARTVRGTVELLLQTIRYPPTVESSTRPRSALLTPPSMHDAEIRSQSAKGFLLSSYAAQLALYSSYYRCRPAACLRGDH